MINENTYNDNKFSVDCAKVNPKTHSCALRGELQCKMH
jgi:hypothetical protein